MEVDGKALQILRAARRGDLTPDGHVVGKAVYWQTSFINELIEAEWLKVDEDRALLTRAGYRLLQA